MKRNKLAMVMCLLMLVGLLSPLLACAKEVAPEKKQLLTLNGCDKTYAAYAVTWGLVDMINRYSPKFKATIAEIPTLAVPDWVSEDPTRISYHSHIGLYQTLKGIEPYKRAYDTKVLASFLDTGAVIMTLDPKIKTLDDLRGKSVGIPSRGSPHDIWVKAMLKSRGISEGEVNWQWLGFPGTKDALLAGKLNAGLCPVTGMPLVPHSTTQDLIASAKEKVYIINPSPKDFEASRQLTGYPFYAIVAKPADSPLVKEDWVGLAVYSLWVVDPRIDDKVVSEVMKIIYEHVGEFKDYFAAVKGLTREYLGVIGFSETVVHPAALKFYKEHKVEVKAERK